jgi:hypothetical protein
VFTPIEAMLADAREGGIWIGRMENNQQWKNRNFAALRRCSQPWAASHDILRFPGPEGSTPLTLGSAVYGSYLFGCSLV